MKSIISLSGGLNSTVLLAKALAAGRECMCVGFQYGATNGPIENQAAVDLAMHYKVTYTCLDLRPAMMGFNSALLSKSGARIPKGKHNDPQMRSTIIPARNMILLSFLSGFAQSMRATEVWFGIHRDAGEIHPDCRPDFFESMNKTATYATGGNVVLYAPFLNSTKADVVQQGIELFTPFEKTRTCYTKEQVACGKCGACQERLQAFQHNRRDDPLPYLTRQLFE